jgi:DNA repair protein RecN (Recombination protein N)
MLSALRIKNLALVTDLTVELKKGFNAITGETGAGKSIIIGALNLVLGQRADRSLIRSGSDSCSVEAVFSIPALCPRLNPLLEENGLEPCADGELILKRVFTAGGTNRQFVNGSPATLNVLSLVGDYLVDMHGPHDHQSLLDPGRQLSLLDAYGKLNGWKDAVAAAARERERLLRRKSELIVDEKTYARELDLLRFQAREVSEARLQPGEDEAVETEHKRASNAARLLELGQSALNALSDDDDSVLSRLAQLGRSLHEAARLDAGAAELSALHEQCAGNLRELQRALSDYNDSVELHPERLVELEQRLNLIQNLKRKYGSTVEEIIQFGEEAGQKLETMEGRDEELARINSDIAKAESAYLKAAQDLSAARKKIAPKFGKAAAKELADLGFKQSVFEAAILPATSKFSPSGQDAIEFEFAPNPGESLKPLRAIASSGELARVMLALKTVLAAEDEIPVLVFDEVDANVGGETAHVVGQKMSQISHARQVLCITHLAPVAAAADTHFVVAKEVIDGRTISTIEQIEKEDRVVELSRMLGGQGAAVRNHAETLLLRKQA